MLKFHRKYLLCLAISVVIVSSLERKSLAETGISVLVASLTYIILSLVWGSPKRNDKMIACLRRHKEHDYDNFNEDKLLGCKIPEGRKLWIKMAGLCNNKEIRACKEFCYRVTLNDSWTGRNFFNPCMTEYSIPTFDSIPIIIDYRSLKHNKSGRFETVITGVDRLANKEEVITSFSKLTYKAVINHIKGKPISCEI